MSVLSEDLKARASCAPIVPTNPTTKKSEYMPNSMIASTYPHT